MCQILCASIGINENDSIIQFPNDGLASVDYFLNEPDETLSSDIMNQLNQLSITSNDSNTMMEMANNETQPTTSIESDNSKCNQTLETIKLDWQKEDLIDNIVNTPDKKRQKTKSSEKVVQNQLNIEVVDPTLDLIQSKQDRQSKCDTTDETSAFDSSNDMDWEEEKIVNSSNESTEEVEPPSLLCLMKPYETNDEEHLSLLRDAIETYDHTSGPKGQSQDFRGAVEACEGAGIELDAITHYIRVNVDAFRNIKLSSPYSKDNKVQKVKAAVDYDMNVLVRFIENSSERYPLPEEKREDIINVVIQRLSLNVDKGNTLKDTFQLSYRKPSPGERIYVYGIPREMLGLVNQQLFNTETFVDQRAFAKQNQVTLSLTKDQVDLFIERASSSDEPDITALQQILNDTHNTSSLPSQEECSRQYFFFKGVVYLVWIDAPPEVLRMLEERCKELYEDVMAVKIGYSGEDLIQHLLKMLDLLTYLAGAKLCWIAIGVPFGLCSALTVEQWVHFIKIELRKAGEWHVREVLTLQTIKHILERIGGKVICRGGNPDGRSGNGTVRTGRQEDGVGWNYFFRQLFTEEELRELWKMFNELLEGAAKDFIKFLLAFKVGATLKKDPKKRIRKAFWALVRGRGVFTAVKGFPKVFEQEAKLHRLFRESQVCCERFMMDTDGNSEIEYGTGLEMEVFLDPLRDNAHYIVVEDEVQRELNKLNYKERETKEWLLKRLISLEKIADMIMKGVFVLCQPSKKATPMKDFSKKTAETISADFWKQQRQRQVYQPTKEEENLLYLATGFRFTPAIERGFPYPWCAKISGKKGWVIRSCPPPPRVGKKFVDRGVEIIGWTSAYKYYEELQLATT